jgi:hypothetical protein
LTQGQVAIVDAFLYEWLMQWNWYVHWNIKTRSFYAVRWQSAIHGGGTAMRMHRQILGLTHDDPRQGDHQNRNSLDNRGANLRPGTPLLNAVNHNLQKNNKSGFRGVRKRKNYERWSAIAKRNGRQRYVGEFSNPIDAAKERDVCVLAEYGEVAIAILNFPELIDEYRAELGRRKVT